jgi:hypothetical protein
MGGRVIHPAIRIATASAAVRRGDLAGAIVVFRRLRDRSTRVDAALARLRKLQANHPTDADDADDADDAGALSSLPGDRASVANALRDLEVALARYANRAANAR